MVITDEWKFSATNDCLMYHKNEDIETGNKYIDDIEIGNKYIDESFWIASNISCIAMLPAAI